MTRRIPREYGEKPKELYAIDREKLSKIYNNPNVSVTNGHTPKGLIGLILDCLVPVPPQKHHSQCDCDDCLFLWLRLKSMQPEPKSTHIMRTTARPGPACPHHPSEKVDWCEICNPEEQPEDYSHGMKLTDAYKPTEHKAVIKKIMCQCKCCCNPAPAEFDVNIDLKNTVPAHQGDCPDECLTCQAHHEGAKLKPSPAEECTCKPDNKALGWTELCQSCFDKNKSKPATPQSDQFSQPAKMVKPAPAEECLCGKGNPNSAKDLNVKEPAIHSVTGCYHIEPPIQAHISSLEAERSKDLKTIKVISDLVTKLEADRSHEDVCDFCQGDKNIGNCIHGEDYLKLEDKLEKAKEGLAAIEKNSAMILPKEPGYNSVEIARSILAELESV